MARRTVLRRTKQRKRNTRNKPASTKELLLEKNSREHYASDKNVWVCSKEPRRGILAEHTAQGRLKPEEMKSPRISRLKLKVDLQESRTGDRC